MAAGRLNGRVTIWDAETGQTSLELKANDYSGDEIVLKRVLNLSFNPDGNSISSISGDGTIRTWNADSGEVLQTIQLGETISAAAWSPDGSQLAYADGDTVQIVLAPQLQTPTPSATIQSEAQTLRDLLTSPDCQIACFLGIEPGVTTRADLEKILNRLGISPEIAIIDPKGLTTVYTFDANNRSPFIVNGANSIGVALGGEQVEQVGFKVSGVTVSNILNWYGAPASIGYDGTNVLVYPDIGLVFTVSGSDHSTIVLVTLRTKSGVIGTFMNTQPCQGSVGLCAIATATPPESNPG